MKIAHQSIEILSELDEKKMAQAIERAGRVCYKSEGKITDTSAVPFVRRLIKHGHEAMIEHASMSVKIITSRAIANEIVRHRVASYAQESTRYCDYSGEIEFVLPDELKANAWMLDACIEAEETYHAMRRDGIPPTDCTRRAASLPQDGADNDREYARVEALPQAPFRA